MILLVSLSVMLLLSSAMLRRRFEQMLPAVAGTAVLICYGLALFQGLRWFVWIAAGGAAACLLWVVAECARGRGGALIERLCRYAFTPGLLAFAVLVGLAVFALRGHVVTGTDDIYYWAIEAKSVFAHQGLVDGAHHLAPRFMTYTPGMPLFEWLGAAVRGECGEGVLFVMLGLFYAVYLLPLARGIRWRQAYLLPLFLLLAVAAPALVNRDAYAMLRVDTAMGVCLGYALCQAWRIAKADQPGWVDWFTLGVTLGVLTLLKQVGVLWAMAPIGLLFMLRANHNRAGRGKAVCWRMAAVPLLLCASWTIFCAAKGLTGTHMAKVSAALAAMAHGTWTPPEGTVALPAAMLRSLLLIPAPEGGTPLLRLPLLGWAAVMVLVPVAFGLRGGITGRLRVRAGLWMLVCAALFMLGFVGVFLTAFTGEVASFVGGDPGSFQYLLERYMSPLLIGGLMLGACVAAEAAAMTRRGRWLGLGSALLALLLLVPWHLLYLNLNPSAYPKTEPEDFALLQEENFWTDDLDAPLDAVVLYGANPTPDKRERLQYALFPVKVVAFFGDMDDAAFVQLLRTDHITHVVCIDDSNPTYEHAVAYCPDGYLETCTPYAVRWEGDTPVIETE